MMGTSGLPLPGALTSASATVAAGTLPAALSAAGLPADAVAATEPAIDADLLFDLLLGNAPDEAKAAAPALPVSGNARGKTPSTDVEATPEVVDPLQLVLAQMPQMQPAQAMPPRLPAGSAAMPAGIADAADAASRQTTAVAGMPVTAMPDAQTDASFAVSSAPTSTSGPDTGADAADAAPVMRWIRPEADTASAGPGAVAAASVSALSMGDGAAPPPARIGTAEVTAPDISSLQATQTTSGSQHIASMSAVPTQPPVLQQPADPAAGYDDRFASHVALMAGQRIGQAEIRVVPEHLGAIDIRLQLDGNDVRAEFHSAQPEVRQALEASLPRLREMLGQHGLQLSHAGVGHGQSQKGQGQHGDGTAPRSGDGPVLSSSEPGSPLPPDFRRGRGLLDVYA